jgi:hypothetical protein
MKRAALIFAALSVAQVALAADWRDQLTPARPGPVPLPRPVIANYRFGWAAFPAAELEARSWRSGDQLLLSGSGRTIGFVRTLWRLDATHQARGSASTLLPLSMRQMEMYRGETRRTELDFTPEKVVRLRETKPGDKGTPKRKTLTFPNLRDLHTALQFARSQRLANGDIVTMVVYPAADPYHATVRVIGRETVKVPAGRFNAIKCDLKVARINQEKNWQLEPHGKFKRATAWLSDDPDRLLLKANAEIFVGSVWAELQSARFPAR